MKNLRVFKYTLLITFILSQFICFSVFAKNSNAISENVFNNNMKQAHIMANKNYVTKSLQLIDSLYVKSSAEQKDALNLLKARIQYNQKKYSESLISYNKISKKSALWITAVEERAWTKIYLGQLNEAIADSHTLMSPLFNDITSPEAYYLSAYVSHQVCDFTRLFKIIDQFKKVSPEKIKKIELALTTKKDNKKSWEIKHYQDVIAQLHLIEADAIQRIYLDQKLKGQRSQIGQNQKSGDYDLQFPYDEDDVWIDEIDHLKVDAKNCPTPIKKVVSL
jgi:L-ribulose-5-phosphate 3-epimerase UlaE